MNWFHKFITTYPATVLGIMAVLCSISTFVSFKGKKLPSFEDPQLGFETRGTEISQRIVAWDKLMEESGPSGSLIINPSELISKVSTVLSRRKRHNLEERGSHSLDDYMPAKTTPEIRMANTSQEDHNNNNKAEKRKRNKNSERRAQVRQIPLPKRDEEDEPGEEYKPFFSMNYNSNFFCDEIQSGYSQIVFSAQSNENLFSYKTITDLCNLQSVLESLPNYMRQCITSDSGDCCNMWSLPNYIAWILKLPDCGHIKKEHVNSTFSLLKSCAKFYREGKLSTKYRGADVPRGCTYNHDVYNIMQYIVDVDFLSQDKSDILKDTSVYLPIAKDSMTLKLFHDMEDILFHESQHFKISAMDLGIKYSLFDEYLVQDIRYLLFSTVFIVICAWAYTGCGFVTFLTITAIFFSLVNAYFIYTFVLGLEFFPFMNILAVIVSLGIGSDDAFIICKVWDRTKKENSHLSKMELVYSVIKHSAVAVFVTTLTTVTAFLSSYWSSVTAVRCFSVFAGLSVLINFVFMVTWILSGIIISSEWPYIPILHWSFSHNADVIYENILNMKSTFDQCLVYFVEKYNLILIVVFTSISVASTFAVLIWPQLQVPDSTEFQLFEQKHPFEQYDLVYKDRFRFSHSYSENNFEDKLPLRFVWGVVPIDSGNYLDPASRGKLHLDSTFDVAAAESQEWLLKFCRHLRMQPFNQVITGPALSNCFIETFKNWMNRKCIDPVDNSNKFPCCDNVTFPYPRRVFNVCVLQAMASLYSVDTFLTSEVAGPRFLKNSTRKSPKIKALVVEFVSNTSYTTSFETMNTFYQQVDTWMKAELSTAPAGMKNGWFVSHVAFFDLQRTLVRDTTISILISMSVALLVLLCVTLNVPLSLIAIFTITCIIFVSVSVLILFGWKLNILESIAISLAIGLSVDFSLHYAVNYKISVDKTNRKVRVFHSLSMMAAPSLMAAITTGVSGMFMLPSVVLPYIQIGLFLVVVSSISWIFATFLQMPLLYRYGPENDYGQFSYSKLKKLFSGLGKRFLKRRNCESEKSCNSSFRRCTSNPIYSVHEMENMDLEEEPASKTKLKRVRAESFSHSPASVCTLQRTQRLSCSLERIPSEANSVIFIHDDEYDRTGYSLNTHVGV